MEAGYDDDGPAVEVLVDLLGSDVENFRLGVHTVGHDTGLCAGQRNGLGIHALQGHGEKRDGRLLAGGKEHVHFALARTFADFAREFDQGIGHAGHGRDHNDDFVACFLSFEHAPGHVLDPRGIADRSAAVFLDDEGHYSTPNTLATDSIVASASSALNPCTIGASGSFKP